MERIKEERMAERRREGYRKVERRESRNVTEGAEKEEGGDEKHHGTHGRRQRG